MALPNHRNNHHGNPRDMKSSSSHVNHADNDDTRLPSQPSSENDSIGSASGRNLHLFHHDAKSSPANIENKDKSSGAHSNDVSKSKDSVLSPAEIKSKKDGSVSNIRHSDDTQQKNTPQPMPHNKSKRLANRKKDDIASVDTHDDTSEPSAPQDGIKQPIAARPPHHKDTESPVPSSPIATPSETMPVDKAVPSANDTIDTPSSKPQSAPAEKMPSGKADDSSPSFNKGDNEPSSRKNNGSSDRKASPSNSPLRSARGGLDSYAKRLANKTSELGLNGAAKGINAVSNAAKKAGSAVKEVGLKIKRTGMAVWNFVSSPVGWISILVIIAIMLTTTILQTYGNGGITCNDSASTDGSSTGSTSGGSSSSLSGGVNWNADAQTVARTFQKSGYSKAATAAALGNFMQESGVSASAYNSSSGATGLGQWLGGRLTNMKSHATAMGKDWHSMDAQADYAVNVEVPPPGGWGTGLASWIKSKYPEQAMSAQGLWSSWASAGSDDASLNKAVFMWMAGWERPGQSESNLENREAKAKAYLAQLNTMDGTWTANGTTPSGVKSSDGSSDDANSSSSSDQAQCLLKDNDVTTSSTTGSFPTDTNNFSWMCNEAKVCKSGDWGPLGAISGSSNPGGYQCVWYAWTRLWMIHGKNASVLAPYSGNGGDIWETLSGKAGWQVDTTPHAGDGLSGHNFGGSTGSAGHVAVVEKVDADPSGWKITISEGNYTSIGAWTGYHGGRTFTKAQLAGTDVHFFRNSAWGGK
jgi:hypothetical protein